MKSRQAVVHQGKFYPPVRPVKDALGIIKQLGDGKAKTIPCPCCAMPTNAPTMLIVVDHYKVTPLEATILSAVWRGKGHPVQTERILDSMYADDPDGGPSATQMYRAFKVALCRLRARLEGSGISIVNVGYRRGYRLVIGTK